MWRALLLVAITLRPIAEAEVTILSVSVVRESHDEVELELTYILTGVRKETLAGAITTFTGSSTGQWAYRLAKLEPGTHRAVITVGRSQEAPEFYLSDGFEITVRGGVSHKHHFAFEKIWCLDPGACGEEARAALKRAATAPLVERLTSVQPSIRLTAEKEADALDEDAKRALLPEILDRLHDGELAVRLQALRVIERFDVSDPILATPLAEAMFDLRTPGFHVSRHRCWRGSPILSTDSRHPRSRPRPTRAMRRRDAMQRKGSSVSRGCDSAHRSRRSVWTRSRTKTIVPRREVFGRALVSTKSRSATCRRRMRDVLVSTRRNV